MNVRRYLSPQAIGQKGSYWTDGARGSATSASFIALTVAGSVIVRSKGSNRPTAEPSSTRSTRSRSGTGLQPVRSAATIAKRTNTLARANRSAGCSEPVLGVESGEFFLHGRRDCLPGMGCHMGQAAPQVEKVVQHSRGLAVL